MHPMDAANVFHVKQVPYRYLEKVINGNYVKQIDAQGSNSNKNVHSNRQTEDIYQKATIKKPPIGYMAGNWPSSPPLRRDAAVAEPTERAVATEERTLW